jgi:hypothetical protein
MMLPVLMLPASVLLASVLLASMLLASGFDAGSVVQRLHFSQFGNT